MSAYYNLPVEISTVVCTRCDTATFGWLAEVFSCGECGGNDFNPADDEEASSDISMEDSSECEGTDFDSADNEQADSDISMEDISDAADIEKRKQEGKRPISDKGSL